MRRETGTRMARAFAPAHVTGVFSPSRFDRDPRARGSVGAGIVLEVGVEAAARWRPGGVPRLRFRSDSRLPLPISRDVARRLVGRRRGTLEVDLVHHLPIGQGFGMSAAGAVATGLAVARVLGRTRREAAEAANLADLLGGGGLGGVASILGGGLEVRVRPGVPPFGRVVHSTFPFPIFLALVGPPIPSPALLRDPEFLDRVRAAAAPELAALTRSADPQALLEAAERFGVALDLAPPALARTISALRSRDLRVAQAMFGRSLYAVPLTPSARRELIRRLTRSGLPSVEVAAAEHGARLVVREGVAHPPPRSPGRLLEPRGPPPNASLLERGRLARLPHDA